MKAIHAGSKGRTSQRTLLFRQNINRNNREWAHFLEGYREWLMTWDMNQYGDDWHTAEDVVSEIYLNIILEPLITNLRPDDSFRHVLLTLCKHKHRDIAKPWRKFLAEKLFLTLRISAHAQRDSQRDAAVGLVGLVEADLMDAMRDGNRAFKTFSQEDLRRWRTFRETGATAKVTAKAMSVHPSAIGRSCKKVDAYVVEKVKVILRRRGIVV